MTATEPTYCRVCALEGKRVPLSKKGVCPFQAAERKMVSAMRRESIRKMVADKDEIAGF